MFFSCLKHKSKIWDLCINKQDKLSEILHNLVNWSCFKDFFFFTGINWNKNTRENDFLQQTQTDEWTCMKVMDELIGVFVYSLHSPWATTLRSSCLVQAFTFSLHSLSYVIPSLPHTGCRVSKHPLGHTHRPVWASQIAPNEQLVQDSSAEKEVWRQRRDSGYRFTPSLTGISLSCPAACPLY